MVTRVQAFLELSDSEIQALLDDTDSATEFAKRVRVQGRYFSHITRRLESGNFLFARWTNSRSANMCAAQKLCRGYDKAVKKRQVNARERFLTELLPVLFVKDSPLEGKQARRLISHWNPEFQWLEYKCQISECGNEGFHAGKPLRLQIDHINGDSRDHRLVNLRYLCPNCHAQTDTFTGKNTKRRRKLRLEVGTAN